MRQLYQKRVSILSAAIAASVVSVVSAVPVIDGTRDTDYGSPLTLQTVQTGFGDNQSELDGLYSNITDGRVNLFFAGNLESNYNKLVIFLDTKSGGQNTILQSSPIQDNYTGLKFDAGFSPDYSIIINRGSADNSMYVDFSELPTAGSGFGGYAGKITVPGTVPANEQIGFGFLTEGALGMPAIELGYNDSNIAGVGGGSDVADQTAAGLVSTGTEFAMDLSALGIVGNFKVMAFINGSSHDFASNQFLPGLPAPQENLGNNANGGLSNIDLTAYAGDQFVEIPYVVQANDWALSTGGEWNTAANWSNNVVPNAANAQALLAGPAGSGTRSIDLGAGVTAQQINFNNATASYALTGGSLTLNASPLIPSLVVSAGTHSIASSVIFQNTARVEVASGSTLSLTGAVSATGLDLFVRGGGTLNMPAIDVNSITVNAGTLNLTGATHTAVRGITIDTGATLDLGSNALIIDYDDGFSPIVDVQAAIADTRLKSSAVTATNRAIGYADTATFVSLTSYDGVPLDATALVFVATLRGDTNLDKTVNFDDLLALAQNYNAAGTLVWTQGDTNGDAAVNFDDLLALAQNYGLSALADGTILTDTQLQSSFAADWALALSTVPEPTSLSVLALGSTLLMRRRK